MTQFLFLPLLALLLLLLNGANVAHGAYLLAMQGDNLAIGAAVTMNTAQVGDDMGAVRPYACNDGSAFTTCRTPFTPASQVAWVQLDLGSALATITGVRLYGVSCATTDGVTITDECRYGLGYSAIFATNEPLTAATLADICNSGECGDGTWQVDWLSGWMASNIDTTINSNTPSPFKRYTDFSFFTTARYVTLVSFSGMYTYINIAELIVFGYPVDALASSRYTAQVGNVTYGPGLCGVTASCGGGVVIPASSQLCNLRAANAVQQLWLDGRCLCRDACLWGPTCTDWAPDSRTWAFTDASGTAWSGTCARVTTAMAAASHATGTLGDKLSLRVPCGQFGPAGCDADKVCVSGVPPPGEYSAVWPGLTLEVCCPLGFGGPACSTPMGCSVRGCLHGGICNKVDENGNAIAAADTVCVLCARGWGGRYCETAVAAVSVPSLLTRTVGNVTYGPEVCGITLDCAISTSGIVVGLAGTVGGDTSCNLVDPDAQEDIYRNECVCSDACLTCSGPDLTGTCSNSGLVCAKCALTSCGYIVGGCGSSGSCVQQNFTGNRVVAPDGVRVFVKAQSVCCPRGWRGNSCEEAVGCSVDGCDNGGSCLLTDLQGAALPLADTRCFGCAPGVDGSQGWGGAFCHIRNTPTFDIVTGSSNGRRLLATEAVRASDARSTTTAVYKEPSRACDCGVSWSAIEIDSDLTHPILVMGNYSSGAAGALLSPMRYSTVTGNAMAPVYSRRVRSHQEAKYQCYVDWNCGGYYFSAVEADDTYIGRVAYWGSAGQRTLEEIDFPITGATERRSVRRIEPNGNCPDATLDPVYYCNLYPSQCNSIITAGGVGNVRIAQSASVSVLATLHFAAYGHRVRNSPNSGCSLVVDWAEDETGCVNKLRAPQALFPVAVNATLTAAVCGNSTRIAASRVYGGLALPQSVSTGTNVTDGGSSHCLCTAPFRATDQSTLTDCAYDLCGLVEGRGLVNPLVAGSTVATVDACVCAGHWGTDSNTCVGNVCDWCSATLCQNLGTVSGSNITSDCECVAIFTGPRCETSLCNATNTATGFNESLWANKDPASVVCDCLDGWTGQLCNDKACVNGQWDYELTRCLCLDGYTGEQCQTAKCAVDQGAWNRTSGACDCYSPWSGTNCTQHTCDNNVMLGTTGWAGVRPFGQPQVDNTTKQWECGCNFPYAPTAYSDTGRPTNCYSHRCNHGTPNANASDVIAPTDACTCSDPYNIGILTDASRCTGFSVDLCPSMCLVATCGLAANATALVGEYVAVKSDDASCCMCQASVGYHLVDGCASFCAFTQPCITSQNSSFLYTTTYTNVSATNGTRNYTYVAVGGEWKCACNADCSDSNDLTNDCSVCITPDRDWVQNTTGLNNGATWEEPADTSSSSSSDSSSSSSSTTQIIAISVAAGVALLFVALQWANMVTKKALEASVATTTRARARILERSQLLGVKAIAVVACFFLPVTHADTPVETAVDAPFVYPDTALWSDRNANGDIPFTVLDTTTGVFNLEPVTMPLEFLGVYTKYSTSPTAFSILYTYEQKLVGPKVQSGRWGRFPNIVREYTYPLAGSAVAIGGTTLPADQLTWSAFTPFGTNSYMPDVYYSLNICGRSNFLCGSGEQVRGTCVSRNAVATVTSGNFRSESDNDTVWFGSQWLALDSPIGQVHRFNYTVRGCNCTSGAYGPLCMSTCPSGSRNLCSGHGECVSGVAITNATDMRTCMCKPTNGVGCHCDQGYTGDRCETAVQTHKLFYPDITEAQMNDTVRYPTAKARNVVMTDFSACCPADSTDCSPMRVPDSFATPATRKSVYTYQIVVGMTPRPLYYTYSQTCTPATPCDAGDTACNCTMPDADTRIHTTYGYSDLLSQHVTSAHVCGEDYATTTAGWKPEQSTVGATNGQGKCWLGYRMIDATTGLHMSASKAYCICNNPNIYHPVRTTELMNEQRRGWFGPNCQYRTCTRRLGVQVPDASGAPVSRNFISADDVQCSGHAAGQVNGASYNYDDDTNPCDDKVVLDTETGVYSNVNSDGRCKACADGWGLYAGLAWQDLKDTGYNYGDIGICSERTFHSGQGAVCGGYGAAITSPVDIVSPVTGQVVKTVDRVSLCNCPSAWGLVSYGTSGLCHRTCDVSQCGGYTNGLCRAITFPAERADGLNSACMCNIGYGGPECTKIDSMWSAREGESATVVCGSAGEPILRSIPTNLTAEEVAVYSADGYADVFWFNSVIVALDREQITAPENAQLYSAYTCQCKAAKAAQGWVLDDDGICAPSCSAIELMSNSTSGELLCSGRGQCVDNPYSPGKACSCEKGWGGDNCGTRILHDALDQECGGTDRGSIVYIDESSVRQACMCNVPYTRNPVVGPYNGLCYEPCPVNSDTGIACSGAEQGDCIADPDTQNDGVCACTSGAFSGSACSEQLVPVFVTASDRHVPCSGHGVPDPDGTGFCSCFSDWSGFACEMGVHDCGHGACFQDNDALGIDIQ